MTLTFSRRLALVYGASLETGRQPDPSSLPSTWVVGVKGVGILLAIVALVGSLRQAPQKSG